MFASGPPWDRLRHHQKKIPPANARMPTATPTPIPADAPPLSDPVPPCPSVELLELLLPVDGSFPAPALTEDPPLPLPLCAGSLPAVCVGFVPLPVVNGGGVMVGVSDGPNTRLPDPRSWPMMVKTALFAPNPGCVPGRRLNQQGVAEVKFSMMGTVALYPEARCIDTVHSALFVSANCGRDRAVNLPCLFPPSQNV